MSDLPPFYPILNLSMLNGGQNKDYLENIKKRLSHLSKRAMFLFKKIKQNYS